MLITDNVTLESVQQAFTTKFPNLKIEFYKKEHEVGEGSADLEKWSTAQTIGEIRTTHQSGDLTIDANLRVADLEQLFHDQYGLNVQVFRKSGGTWLQTTATDDWTLAEQNSRGNN